MNTSPSTFIFICIGIATLIFGAIALLVRTLPLKKGFSPTILLVLSWLFNMGAMYFILPIIFMEGFIRQILPQGLLDTIVTSNTFDGDWHYSIAWKYHFINGSHMPTIVCMAISMTVIMMTLTLLKQKLAQAGDNELRSQPA